MTVQYIDPFGPPWKFQYLRLIFTWDGGIIQNLWLEWTLAVGLCSVLVGITYVVYHDNEYSDLSPSIETLASVFGFIGRRFQAALGMMLAFYNGTMFNRWTAVRNKEGDVLRGINDVAMQIAWRIYERENDPSADDDNNSLKGKEDEKNSQEQVRKSYINGDVNKIHKDSPDRSVESIRTELIRWVNLSHAIVVGEVYEKKDNEFSSLEKLLAYGLVSRKEYTLFKADRCEFKYAAPLVWFQHTINRLGEAGKYGLDGATINQFAGPLLQIRGGLGDLLRFRNEPVPLIYRQMVNAAVRVYMLMLLLDATFGELVREKDGGLLHTSFFWIILKFAFEYFLFVGWLTTADAMGNPFRTWRDELEWINLVKTISKSSLRIALNYGGSGDEMEEGEEAQTKFADQCDSWSSHWNYNAMYEDDRYIFQKSSLKDQVTHTRGGERRKVITGF